MTTDQIRFFLSLANQLNFRMVAERFFITQPTLSRQIASLEEELKVKLFERSPKGVALTPAGEVFQKGIAEVYRDMQEVITQTRKTAGRQETSLVIAIQDDQYLNDALVQTVQEFMVRYPEVRVILSRVPANALFDGLLTGEFDVISMIDVDGQYLRGTEYERLAKERTCIAMQKKLAGRYNGEIRPEELEELTRQVPLNILSPDHFTNGSEPLQSLVKNLGVRLEKLCCHPDAEESSLALHVAGGLCLGIVNESHMLGGEPEVTLVPVQGAAPICTMILCKPERMRKQTADFFALFRQRQKNATL